MRGFVAGLGMLLLTSSVYAGEVKVPVGAVPKAVLSAVKARFADAEITGAAKEREEGKTVFEITLRQGGRTVDVTLSPKGSILLIERELGPTELPVPVSQAIDAKYPKAMRKMAEEVIKVEGKDEKLAFYEVLLFRADGKSVEVKLAPDGKILGEELKAPGDLD